MTMTTAEAIRILENIETDIYGRIAISKAIDAMRRDIGMTREEAIAKIQGLLDDPIVRGGVAFVDQPTLRSIQDALRNPWVKTSDRLPTADDADEDGKIPVLSIGCLTGRWVKMSVHYKTVPTNVEMIKYFLPIPPLPEV